MDSREKKEESSMDSVEAVEKILNYSFANKNLLKDAVIRTCRSFKRLEFLGDSVLNLAFTNYFHLTFPDLKDHELTELRHVNTCNDKFARVAVKRGLFPFLICSRQRDLLDKIEAFSEAVSKEDDLVWYQGSAEAPKILADLVEAIAGAVYIDVDFDLLRFWEVLKGLLEPIFMPDDLRRRYQPVDTLVRLGKKRVVFKYCNEDETRVVANVYFDGKFIASGHDKTECRAKIAAAKEALQKMSECMPIQKIIDEPSSLGIRKKVDERNLEVENEADKGSLEVKKGHGEVEEKPDLQMQEESLEEKNNLQMDSVEGVEKILNYSFSNKSLLKEAITHKSGMMSRLKILGDTALGLAFTKYFYFTYPKLSAMGLSWPRLHQVATLHRLGKNRVDMRFCTPKKRKFLAKKMIVVHGCDEVKYHAEITAAKKALQELSECMPVNRLIYQESLDIEKEHKEVVVLNIQTRSCSRKLQLENSLDENKNLLMQGNLEEKQDLQMQECPEEKKKKRKKKKKNLHMQESLEENKNLQETLELEEKKNLQMQECSGEKKNMQMDPVEAMEKKNLLMDPVEVVENKNLQMDPVEEVENKNLQMDPVEAVENKNLQMDPVEAVENKNLQMDPVEAVEKILSYSFTNKSILKEAITYKSSMMSRLQILGKMALDLAFTKYLYFAFPDLTTMGINSLRSVNRCTEKYARVAIKHGLDTFLIFDRRLHPHIDEKVKLFSEAVSKEDGPVLHGGLVIAPKILSGIIESIAGAVYVDVNYNVSRLWEICKGLFEPFYTLDDLQRQPQSVHVLTRLGDKRGKQIDFRYLEDTNRCYTCEVYMDDEFIACGQSQCRDSAKLAAANAALLKLSESKATKMVMDVIENTEIEEETVIENTEIEEETVIDNTAIEEETVVEIEHAKDKLIKICNKRKWPKPIYSVVSQDHVKGFVCSVEIETPTEEGTLIIKGDSKKRKKLAETNSASHMLRALEFSIKDDLWNFL